MTTNHTNPPAAVLHQALLAARAAVTEVGQMVVRAQPGLRPRQVRRKGCGDFVTSIDLRAERRLRHCLLAGVPEAGFLGEESAAEGLDRPYVWVVDPIDGTSNFANGLPHFAVAAVLLFHRDPVVAAVFSAVEQAFYHAVRGRGAWRDGRPIRIGRGRLDDGALIGCQWHQGQRELQFLARLQQGGGRLRSYGCTVAQILDVAMGRLDANVQQQGRIWDFAAVGLVLQEAGGRLTDWSGTSVFPLARLHLGHTATVATAGNIHRRLVRWLEGAGDPLVVPTR